MSENEIIFKTAGLRLRVVVPESGRITCTACNGLGHTHYTEWLGRFVGIPTRLPCEWCKGNGTVYEATLDLTNKD